MEDAREAGRRLAVRHAAGERQQAEGEGASSLLQYAESSRAGDWSLRSALVRLAQPEPVRAGAVLDLIRRCDGALAPYVRPLEATVVVTDPDIDLPSLLDGSEMTATGRPDVRTADLARLALRHPEQFPAVLDGYRAEVELIDAELEALPLLEVAAILDALAVNLTDWAADEASDPPPCDEVDGRCAQAFERLEALGVARDEWPRRPGRRDSG